MCVVTILAVSRCDLGLPKTRNPAKNHAERRMTLKFSDLIGLGKEGCLRPKRKFLVLGFRSSTCIVGKFACDRHTLVRRVALDKITDPSSHVTRTRDILFTMHYAQIYRKYVFFY